MAIGLQMEQSFRALQQDLQALREIKGIKAIVNMPNSKANMRRITSGPTFLTPRVGRTPREGLLLVEGTLLPFGAMVEKQCASFIRAADANV